MDPANGVRYRSSDSVAEGWGAGLHPTGTEKLRDDIIPHSLPVSDSPELGWQVDGTMTVLSAHSECVRECTVGSQSLVEP